MAIKNLFMALTNATGVKEVTVNESYGQASVQAEVVCTGQTLSIGDTVTLDVGYNDEHQAVITNGIVKSITVRKPEFDYVIQVYDKLVRAVDYFMASDNPDAPFTANNISGEQLVVNLLAQAGVTGITTEATGFTFATVTPTPINLQSVWEAVSNICSITGFACFVEPDGTVKFVNRKPYIVGGDTIEKTFTTGASGDLLGVAYTKSDEKLRNRVVVYGAPGINAQASAVSAYLPSGFYKSMVIAHDLIDSQSQAQAAADLNLTMFHRLTEVVKIQALGKPSIRCRKIVAVSESFSGLSGTDKWFVHAARHSLSRGGYSMDLTLVR